MKEVKIGDNNYKIDCNALTYIEFKKIFGIGIYEDINVIRKYMLKQLELIKEAQKDNVDVKKIVEIVSRAQIDDVSSFIESITRITYILIKTADENFMEYNEWLKTFNPKLQDSWISEVTGYTVDCFC